MVAGSSVTLTCEVDAVPEPTITWLQNENQLLNNVNKTSLTVDNPSRVNLQTVSCTAANILGSDSKSSYFTILGKKSFSPQVKSLPQPKFYHCKQFYLWVFQVSFQNKMYRGINILSLVVINVVNFP